MHHRIMVRSERESKNEIATFRALKPQIPAISNASESGKQNPAQSLRALFTDDSIFSLGRAKQLYGIFAGRGCYDLESPVSKAVFDDAPNKMVVLDDQNNRQIFHPSLPAAPHQMNDEITRERDFGSAR